MLRSTRSLSTVKLAARDAPGNLSTLSVVVNGAGSKNGKSGVAHLLSKFNFLNTTSKSALRFTRESELLGGVFSSTVGRDATVLKTSFLKQDLPYYVEALGNVLANTSYRPHEYPETVLPSAKAEYEAATASNTFTGLEALHDVSFKRGLGQPLYYDGTAPVSLEDIQSLASQAYTSSNVSIYGSGINSEDLAKFVGESAFSALPAGSASSSPSVEFFKGKEARIRAKGVSAAFIGVPVKPADFGKYEALSAAVGNTLLPGAATPLAKIPGASSFLYKYQDAGLFVVSVTGAAGDVAQGIKAAKQALAVSKSELSDAVKAAQLSVALQSTFENPLSIKIEAGDASVADFNYVAIGDVDVLPYANEL